MMKLAREIHELDVDQPDAVCLLKVCSSQEKVGYMEKSFGPFRAEQKAPSSVRSCRWSRHGVLAFPRNAVERKALMTLSTSRLRRMVT